MKLRTAAAGVALVMGMACGMPVVEAEREAWQTTDSAGNALTGKIFIVQLNDAATIDVTLDALSTAHGLRVMNRYHNALRGGALLIPNEATLLRVKADARVAQVDEDQLVFASGKPPPPPPPPPPAQVSPTGYRLVGANTLANRGAGVRVAVLDTGIDLTHPDLAANIDLTYAKDCVNESGPTYGDGDGHGTHTSGTIAALDNGFGSVGIAPQANIVPVKVLNRRGSGTWSQIICGIDHVTANAGAISVANMSLGGGGSECNGSGCTKSALQLAIEASVAAGVTYVVAAGNEASNASTSVPAAYEVVVTVSAYSDANGAISSTDGWASFTNYGARVDIAAPGVGIYSTYKGGGYATLNGTSMAAPHVAGAAALFIATHPGASPQIVRDRLRALGTAVYPASTDPKHGEPLLDARGLGLCTLTCSGLGFDCGSVSDGCGAFMACGSCSGQQTCGGGGSANTCGCTATVTCATAGATCGAIVDDCGVALDCGACTEPESCGGGGVPNTCGIPD